MDLVFLQEKALLTAAIPASAHSAQFAISHNKKWPGSISEAGPCALCCAYLFTLPIPRFHSPCSHPELFRLLRGNLLDRPLLLRITIFTDMPLQQFRECLFTHIFYPDPGKRTSGIFPFSYSPNDHLLTAKVHNHLCKDLRTHCELVNHRELIRAVHVVLGLRKGSAEGNTVL